MIRTHAPLFVAALALSGCASTPTAPPPATAPAPVIYRNDGRPIVCLSEPHEGKTEWRAACAPIGPWAACTETADTLRCAGGRPTRYD